jgi:aerobic carbon-monoxide dehydrogenase medium subunit
VKPAPFAYHRAHSVGEAVALLTELGDEAKILAGGLSLVPMMNFRLARPSALIDILGILDLSYLRVDNSGLHIGALTTHRTVETTRDPAIRHAYGVLPRSARWIGHYPIRSRGTFGGSIAHADPASEWCLLAVLLDAQIVLTGPEGHRNVPAAEFFQGYYTTAASPDEMITELWFPRPEPSAVAGGPGQLNTVAGGPGQLNSVLTEFAPRQGDFAVVAAAVSVTVDEGVCRSGRIVLGGVGPQPVPVDAGALAGQPAVPETWAAMGEHAASQIDPPGDTHGSGEYRRRLAATLVERALAEASQDST